MESKKFVAGQKGTTLSKDDVVKMKEIEESKRKDVPFIMFVYLWFRSYLLQSSMNYSNYQGNGYAYSLFPALKRIYAGNVEGLKESLRKNSLFFNSNPQLVPLIYSIHIVMLMSGKTEDEAIMMKMALMGPLSGVGDSLSQFAIAPIFSSVCASMALEGSIAGPIIFIVGINIVLICIKILTGYIGYKLGVKYIAKLSEKLKIVLNAALMVGITIIVALAISFTKVNLHIIKEGLDNEGNPIIEFDLAKVFNNMFPYLLSIILVVVVYGLIKKAQWSTVKVILALMVIGIVGGATGVLI